MLYIFDLDDTLISSYMRNPGRVYDEWHVLPRRRERLAELLQEGHTIGIATNQAGVAFGHVTEVQVEAKIAAALLALGLPEDTPYEACYGHERGRLKEYRGKPRIICRKPSGHMIRELMARFPQATATGVVYVGDRPEDQAAAEDAGVQFRWAEDFFAEPMTLDAG
ncbi:MAG: HAD-IIIA family hydrolase [Ardenticatenaceae bacterium]|nr:HAD-IIIA family hydrolase [Ardenticatenaceae bacterium]HBY98678.1 hypothetical protein [Chloroflexota bacterium]